MAVFILLFILDMVFAVLYVNYGFPKVTKLSFFYKMFASLIFVINGVLAYVMSTGSTYGKTVIAGLALGFAGDALLAIDPFLKGKALEHKTVFGVAGAAFFFLGHIMYIISFIIEIKKENAFSLPLFLIAWIVMLAIGIAIKIKLKVALGKFAYPVLAYALALCAMCSLGICLAVHNGGNRLLQLFLIIGPLCFVFSDATIVLRMFYKDKYETIPMRYANLITYFVSQMLIGTSIFMLYS